MAPAVPLRTPPHGGGMQRRRHRRAVETARSADPDPAGRARIGTAFPLFRPFAPDLHAEHRRSVGDHQNRRMVHRHAQEGRGRRADNHHRHGRPERGRRPHGRTHGPRQQRQLPPPGLHGEDLQPLAGRLPGSRNHRHGHRRGPDRIPGGRSRTGRPAGQRLLRLDIDRGQRNLGHRSAQERQGRHGNHRHRHTEGQHREQAQRIDAHDHRPGPRIQRQQRRAGYRAFAGGLPARGLARRGLFVLQRRFLVDSRQLGEPLLQIRMAHRQCRRHQRQ